MRRAVHRTNLQNRIQVRTDLEHDILLHALLQWASHSLYFLHVHAVSDLLGRQMTIFKALQNTYHFGCRTCDKSDKYYTLRCDFPPGVWHLDVRE